LIRELIVLLAFLLGEITGDRNFALQTMEETGLDAALGVQDVDGKMELLAKGSAAPLKALLCLEQRRRPWLRLAHRCHRIEPVHSGDSVYLLWH
jgi:hypothetical protein